jgi:hypothetical protein
MKTFQQRLETTVTQLIELALRSGLTWDGAVAAFGVASKGLAVNAAAHGDGSKEYCEAHAKKRFAQGFERDIEIMITGIPDIAE